MITPEPPAGSEHYREGWRHGYEQAAIDRERSTDAVRLVPATLNSELKVGAVPDTGQARADHLAAGIRKFADDCKLLLDFGGLDNRVARSIAQQERNLRALLAERSGDTVQAPDVAATALRDAARLLDMVADARDVYLEGMEEDSESAVAIETFGSGIRSAARILRAEPHTVELLVPTWRYLGELAELNLRVRALSGADTTPDRLAWISEAGETAAAERQARYQETACALRPAEEHPDA